MLSTVVVYANKYGYGGIKFFHNLTTNQQNTINIIANGSRISGKIMNGMEKIDSVYTNLHEGFAFETPTKTLESLKKIGYTIIDATSLIGGLESLVPARKTDKALETFGVYDFVGEKIASAFN